MVSEYRACKQLLCVVPKFLLQYIAIFIVYSVATSIGYNFALGNEM